LLVPLLWHLVEGYEMRKIFLAGIFVFCLIAGSAMVSADWFGSAFNRNITGFAVLDGGAASSGADSNAAKAAEISAKAAQVKNLLQKQREAKAIRKKAYEEERQKAKEAKKEIKSGIKAVISQAKDAAAEIKSEAKSEIKAIIADANKTRPEKKDEVNAVKKETKAQISEVKEKVKSTLEEARKKVAQARQALQAKKDEAKKKALEAAKARRDARKGASAPGTTDSNVLASA